MRAASVPGVVFGNQPAPGFQFRRIDLSRNWEAVATQIRDAIVTGDLQPGDRLDSQRELASAFGVSRAVVNEALRVLEHSGLIEVHPGAHGGSYVRAPAADDLIRHFGVLVRLGGVSLEELTDFRAALEGRNAQWAAIRATPADIQKLREIAEQARRAAVNEAASELNLADAQFHSAVAEAAGNKLSVAVVRGVTPALQQLVGLVPTSQAPDAADQMARVTDAIGRRKPSRARRLMEEHIRHFAGVVAAHDP